MCCPSLSHLRFALHLDRIALRAKQSRWWHRLARAFRRRPRHSPPQPHTHQSAHPRLHPPPRLPGRNRPLRRSLQRRSQLPQPQSIRRRLPRRSRRPLHPRHWRHLRPHPHRLLPSHPHRRPLPPRRRLPQAPPRLLTPFVNVAASFSPASFFAFVVAQCALLPFLPPAGGSPLTPYFCSGWPTLWVLAIKGWAPVRLSRLSHWIDLQKAL